RYIPPDNPSIISSEVNGRSSNFEPHKSYKMIRSMVCPSVAIPNLSRTGFGKTRTLSASLLTLDVTICRSSRYLGQIWYPEKYGDENSYCPPKPTKLHT